MKNDKLSRQGTAIKNKKIVKSVQFGRLHYALFFIFMLVLFNSCKKTEPSLPSLNINYPAAFVVNGQDNSISVIDLRVNEVKEVIYINQSSLTTNLNFPHHIYLSPDASKLVVSIPGHDLSQSHNFTGAETILGGVLVIDSHSGAFLNFIATEKMNHNALYSPDGSEIWTGLLTHKSPAVLIFDNNLKMTNQITNIEVEPVEITFSANGKYAFVPTGEGRFLQVFDAKTKQNITNIKVDLAPEAAWAGSDGNMYVTSAISQSVTVINVETLQVSASIDLGFPPAYARFNAFSQELWVSHSTGNEVVIYEKVNNLWQKKQSVQVGNDAHAVVFTKDEKTCYVTNQGDGTVSVIDVLNKKVIKTIKVGSKPNGIVLNE